MVLVVHSGEEEGGDAVGAQASGSARVVPSRAAPGAADVRRIGVISNTRSRRNRRGTEAVRAVLAAHPRALHAELDGVDEIGAVLREFARREVDLIAVNAGDGTVQATLTALLNGAAFERPPRLAVVPAGGANLIARDVGLRGKPTEALARLLERAPGGDGLARLPRPVLTVGRGPDRPPLHGMFFGAGAFYRGTAFAHEQLYPRGVGEPLAAGVALGWCIGRALLSRLRPGGAADPLRHGAPMTVAADGEDAPERRYVLVVATTLHRLIFGLTPFWGAGDGPIRYTSIVARPRRLVRALVPVLRGRPRPWLAESGYRSGTAGRLVVTMDEPAVLDGEILPAAAPGTPLVVESDRSVVFVRC